MEKFFELMINRAKEAGIVMGKEAEKIEGENCLAKLIGFLLSEGKNDTLKEVPEDENVRHKLYKEYGIQ